MAPPTERRVEKVRPEPDPPAQPALVECLEGLLEQAKRGEVLGLAYIEVSRGRYYRWHRVGWLPSGERLLGEMRLMEEDLVRECWMQREGW